MSTIATPIDAEKVAKIHELAGQGLSTAAIAEELSIGETTVRKYRRPNGEAANGNGHVSHSADLDEIERLLAARWQRLTLIERLQFFLGRD